MAIYLLVTRWTNTEKGVEPFERRHEREARDANHAKRLERVHNRTRLSGSKDAEEFAADGWMPEIIRCARICTPEGD